MNVPKPDLPGKLLLTLLAVIFAWWTFIQVTGVTDSPTNYYFSFFYGLIPTIFGFYILLRPYAKDKANKSLLMSVKFFALGLVFWGVGETIWSYYNLFLNIDVPYPSLADTAFVLSLPMWSFGILFLSKGLGLPF